MRPDFVKLKSAYWNEDTNVSAKLETETLTHTTKTSETLTFPWWSKHSCLRLT